MTALRAILFDVDDTLCATTEFARRARLNAVRAMIDAGLDVPEAEIYAELQEVIREFSSNYEHHFDKLLLRFPREKTDHLNRALVVAAGVTAYHDTKFREWKPFPGVTELFSELKLTGIQLGIITHGLAVKQAEKLIRLQLLPYLDPKAIFISDAIGISKPNPKLYQLALRRLGLEAHQVMYVGDNPTNDIDPPNSLGMITVWARAMAKHAEGDHQPTHVIESFSDLRQLLTDQYGFKLNSGV